MWEMILVSFGIFVGFMAAMAVGVLLSDRRLKGSCGGLNNVMGDDCDFCEKKDQCPAEKKQTAMGAAPSGPCKVFLT